MPLLFSPRLAYCQFMRRIVAVLLCLATLLAVVACLPPSQKVIKRALKTVTTRFLSAA
jgi:hypothetical protein